MTAEKTNGSPSEDIQQLIKIEKPNEAQEEGDERNVNASLRTQEAIVNAFGMFDWVTEEGWLHIPRKRLEEDVIEEANNGNIANEVYEKELFKLFIQSLECIKTNIFLKLPLTTTTSIMEVPPIMVIPLTIVLRI
jgi:hypothetical protein